MADVLIFRSCRLVLDAWREETRRIALLRYGHMIIRLRMCGKLFFSWRSLLLGICFRHIVEERRNCKKFRKSIFHAWHLHVTILCNKYRTLWNNSSRKRVLLSIARWRSHLIEMTNLYGKNRAISLVHESRMLQSSLWTLKSIFHERRTAKKHLALSANRYGSRSLNMTVSEGMNRERKYLSRSIERSVSLSGLRRKM